jgi:hypothetical protein
MPKFSHSTLFEGPSYKNKSQISSRLSDTSEKSAGLRSLAGSHNFNTNTTNLESVFGSTISSGSAFSYNQNTPMKAIPNNMGATARSGLAGGEVKYMTNDELTPLSNAQYEFSASLEDLGKKDDWGIQFEGCNTVR